METISSCMTSSPRLMVACTTPKGMIPKITVYEWNYVPTGKRTEGSNANADAGTPASAGDGFMDMEDCGENGLPFN